MGFVNDDCIHIEAIDGIPGVGTGDVSILRRDDDALLFQTAPQRPGVASVEFFVSDAGHEDRVVYLTLDELFRLLEDELPSVGEERAGSTLFEHQGHQGR